MNDFNGQLLNDIHGVFLNLDEFGEIHNIDGVDMVSLLDKDDTVPFDVKNSFGSNIRYTGTQRGLYTDVLVLYVALKDFGERPCEGQRITVDGLIYEVGGVSCEAGLLSITIEAVGA